ncbi:hypothetical protein [Galbitalea soli]|uniref:Uncharacterized protein n=1 Tax=Galbitalea soli TaxID=1268042 RepID=A0A7C9TRA9_9MICO|nr:hypothetical protein [Galbitalea soli]NEM90903.1 hypothetical protein [Galbitalea soli]NYJ31626.1 hypothetical protein [Galbitalea soli]
MSAQGTFLASTGVALVCVFFSLWQGKRLSREIDRVRPLQTSEATLAQSPEVIRAYIGQSLEVAYGFPAAALTIVAFGDLLEWSGLTGILLVCVAVAATLFFVWFVSPSRAGFFLKFRLFDVSIVTWAVLAANIAGLILAFTAELPASEPLVH